MHELSIAMSILDVAREESEQRGGVRVEVIHLKIGALSGVVKDALLFCLSARVTGNCIRRLPSRNRRDPGHDPLFSM